ncbi:helix-turn-helix domain-containing protein [Altererythrobacter sp. ZODW24]|uniref:helix-turn-helix domain-containing protein n=1 Tax=Altererythrobacter sp. ZODW24 TaxID=2185142 RepID=UPI001F08870F|nr:helix-turn-helix domain-containing protein [Altererythrobacter sp. ZODW24]
MIATEAAEKGDAVSVRFFAPSSGLRRYITTFYAMDIDNSTGEVVEDWLHPEWGNVRFAGEGVMQSAVGDSKPGPTPSCVATGPTSLATHFRIESGRSWGIGLLPAGWAKFVDAPAEAYRDRYCDAAIDPAFAAFAPLSAQLRGQKGDIEAEAALIEAHMAGLMDRPVEDEEKIIAAHEALIDPDLATVSDLAERVGVSTRSFERLSLKAFGFSPKLLLRRQRFLRSLAQFMLDPSLSWLSTLDTHYHDQAHFVRDFRRFMTMSPSDYAALDKPAMLAAAKARMALAGEAVQVLHAPR